MTGESRRRNTIFRPCSPIAWSSLEKDGCRATRLSMAGRARYRAVRKASTVPSRAPRKAYRVPRKISEDRTAEQGEGGARNEGDGGHRVAQNEGDGPPGAEPVHPAREAGDQPRQGAAEDEEYPDDTNPERNEQPAFRPEVVLGCFGRGGVGHRTSLVRQYGPRARSGNNGSKAAWPPERSESCAQSRAPVVSSKPIPRASDRFPPVPACRPRSGVPEARGLRSSCRPLLHGG